MALSPLEAYLQQYGLGESAPPEEEESPFAPSPIVPYTPPAYTPEPPASTHGPLRTLWDYSVSPIKALTGLTGTSLVHALGIRSMFPEAYKSAAEELRAAQPAGAEWTKGAQALPALGDVAVQGLSPEFKESGLGKAIEPTLRLGLNILGDPTTYVGMGLLSRIPRAAAVVGAAQKAQQSAALAGDMARAEEIGRTVLIPAVQRATRLVEAETPIGRGLRSLEELGRVGAPAGAVAAMRAAPDFTSAAKYAGRLGLTLPFSPLVGLAYAPEVVEGTLGQLGQTYEDVRAGKYAEAAAHGAGTLLTAGLGTLVGKGVLDEFKAAKVLEDALAPALGEVGRPAPSAAPPGYGAESLGGPAEPAVPPRTQEGAFVMPPSTLEGEGEGPITMRPTPPATAAPAPVTGAPPVTQPPVTQPPTPPVAAGAVDRWEDKQRQISGGDPTVLQGIQQKFIDLFQQRVIAEGGELSKQDLLAIGLKPGHIKSRGGGKIPGDWPHIIDGILGPENGPKFRQMVEVGKGGGLRVKTGAPAPMTGTGAVPTPPPAAAPTPAGPVPTAAAPAAQPLGRVGAGPVSLPVSRSRIQELMDSGMTLPDAQRQAVDEQVAATQARAAAPISAEPIAPARTPVEELTARGYDPNHIAAMSPEDLAAAAAEPPSNKDIWRQLQYPPTAEATFDQLGTLIRESGVDPKLDLSSFRSVVQQSNLSTLEKARVYRMAGQIAKKPAFSGSLTRYSEEAAPPLRTLRKGKEGLEVDRAVIEGEGRGYRPPIEEAAGQARIPGRRYEAATREPSQMSPEEYAALLSRQTATPEELAAALQGLREPTGVRGQEPRLPELQGPALGYPPLPPTPPGPARAVSWTVPPGASKPEPSLPVLSPVEMPTPARAGPPEPTPRQDLIDYLQQMGMRPPREVAPGPSAPIRFPPVPEVAPGTEVMPAAIPRRGPAEVVPPGEPASQVSAAGYLKGPVASLAQQATNRQLEALVKMGFSDAQAEMLVRSMGGTPPSWGIRTAQRTGATPEFRAVPAGPGEVEHVPTERTPDLALARDLVDESVRRFAREGHLVYPPTGQPLTYDQIDQMVRSSFGKGLREMSYDESVRVLFGDGGILSKRVVVGTTPEGMPIYQGGFQPKGIPTGKGEPLRGITLDIHPEVLARASDNLTGSDVSKGPQREGFVYDPASPAGRVLAMIRRFERRGNVEAEDQLQNTVMRWLKDLSTTPEQVATEAEVRRDLWVDRRRHDIEKALSDGDEATAKSLTDSYEHDYKLKIAELRRWERNRLHRIELLNTDRASLPAEVQAAQIAELASLLGQDLKQRNRSYWDSKRNPRVLDARLDATDGLTPDEISKLGVEAPTTGDVTPRAAPAAKVSYRPDNMPLDVYQRQVGESLIRADPSDPSTMPPILSTIYHAQHLQERAMEKAKTAGGSTAARPQLRTGRGTTKSEPITILLRVAEDLGVKVQSTDTSFNRISEMVKNRLKKLATEARTRSRSFSAQEVDPKQILNDQVLAARVDRYFDAYSKAPVVGTGDARVVDLENDAGDLGKALVAAVGNDMPDALSRVLEDIATMSGLPVRFGGFIFTPQLEGGHMRNLPGAGGVDSILVNLLEHRARSVDAVNNSPSGSFWQGERLTGLHNEATAESIIGTLVHEVAHHIATGHAGPEAYIRAYSDVLKKVSPSFTELTRAVQNAFAPRAAELDALLPRYNEARAEWRKRWNESQRGVEGGAGAEVGIGTGARGEPRAGPGELGLGAAAGGAQGARGVAGAGGPAPVQPGRGGGPAGAPGPVAAGIRPEGAVRGGAPEAVARTGVAPIPGEGVAPGGAGRAPEAGRGAGPGEIGPQLATGGLGEPGGQPAFSGSLTSFVKGIYNESANRRAVEEIVRGFAAAVGRAIDPSAADKELAQMNAALKLQRDNPEAFARLLAAKPHGRKGEQDIAVNLIRSLPPDLISEEQRAGVGLALLAHKGSYARDTPMPYHAVDERVLRMMGIKTPEEWLRFLRSPGKGPKTVADHALLNTLGVTFGMAVDRAKAKVLFLNEQLANLRRQGVTSGPQMEALTADMLRARDEMAAATIRRDAAMDTVIDPLTTAARIVGMRRAFAKPLGEGELFSSRFAGALRNSRIPADQVDRLTRMANSIIQGPNPGDWDVFLHEFRKAQKVNRFDQFIEFWKAGLLGWPTQFANILSNAAFFGLRRMENAASVLTSRFFRGLTGKPQERFVGEIAARNFGTQKALTDAWRGLLGDLKDAFRLQPPDLVRRFSEGTALDDPDLRQIYGAIPGRTGEFIRTPFKLLDAFDNFFKTLVRGQEYAAQSVRLAHDARFRSPGESVQHATGRIYSEIIAASRDPFTHSDWYERYSAKAKAGGHGNVFEIAKKAAMEETFQTPLNEMMRRIYQGTQAHPSLQLLFPFFKTPYNLIGEGMKRTPLGAIWAISEFRRGGIDDIKFVDKMVKSALGSTIMGLASTYALDGGITGGGPADPKEAEMKKRTGWSPYSIRFKVGDKYHYFSYRRIEPFSTLLGISADIAEAWQRKDIDTASELFSKGVASVSDNITNKSFLTGLDSMVKILNDPTQEGLTAMKQLEASLVPNILGTIPVAQMARAVDPYYRETEAMSPSPIISSIPWLSQTLPPQRRPTGEPRERPGTPLERLFSPFIHTVEQTGPIAEAAGEISRLGIQIQPPQPDFKVGQDRVYYLPEEREAIAQAQERGFAAVGKLIKNSSYKRLPDDETLTTDGAPTKRDLILKTIDRYRQPVALKMRQKALYRARHPEGQSG